LISIIRWSLPAMDEVRQNPCRGSVMAFHHALAVNTFRRIASRDFA
jgi:hypothetical protein